MAISPKQSLDVIVELLKSKTQQLVDQNPEVQSGRQELVVPVLSEFRSIPMPDLVDAMRKLEYDRKSAFYLQFRNIWFDSTNLMTIRAWCNPPTLENVKKQIDQLVDEEVEKMSTSANQVEINLSEFAMIYGELAVESLKSLEKLYTEELTICWRSFEVKYTPQVALTLTLVR